MSTVNSQSNLIHSSCLPAFLLLLIAQLAPTGARASDLPPWRDADDLPLPDGVRSAVVLRPEEAIVQEPSITAARRGTALVGARLPVFGAKRGPGCAARWIGVGPDAWVCQDAVTLEGSAPIDPFATGPAAQNGLPFRYYFVGRDGSNGYSRLADAEDVAPDQELEPGFAVAVVDEGMKGVDRYARTHHGAWVPMRDLVAVPAFSFHGEEVKGGKLDFGWVVEDKAPVLASASAGARPAKGAKPRLRFEKVDILEEKIAGGPKAAPSNTSADKKGGFYRVGDGEWLRARDVRRPAASPLPSSIRPGERWIDVDLASQTLVAFEGDRPVFATIVSTGKGKEGTDTATPRGESRIWVKLLSSNMDNLEDEEAQKYYAIEDVPYVQYFAKGVGLHGAFWHRGFGKVRSHGCVNLAPLDAQRLFAFTSPHLPAGWTAALPSAIEEGTLVRVR
jgi:lipoprotein-anchoring transpeptidase ErfK/SrfK